jgi:hypothetical protein
MRFGAARVFPKSPEQWTALDVQAAGPRCAVDPKSFNAGLKII